MPKKEDKKEKGTCPNCGGKGSFYDDGQKKTCPCQALKD